MSLKDLIGYKASHGINLKRSLDSFLVQQQKEADKRYKEYAKRVHLSPSMLHKCQREIVFRFVGMPEESSYKSSGASQRILDNGSGFHRRMQRYYGDMGVLWGNWKCTSCPGHVDHEAIAHVDEELVHTGCEFEACFKPQCPRSFSRETEISPSIKYQELRFEITELNLSGKCDGIIYINDVRCGIELKSMREDYWKILVGPTENNLVQGCTYILGLNLEYMIYQYENKNDQKIKEFVLKRDDEEITKIRTKCRRILSAVENGILLPRVCRAKVEGRWCNFQEICFAENIEQEFNRIWQEDRRQDENSE